MKFLNIIVSRITLVIAVVVITSTIAFGQSDLASPYTLYGPGLPNLRQTVSMAGAGGSGIALADPYKMNFANPAAVAYHLEPIFETSGKGTYSTYRTNLGSFDNNAFILNNLHLSFPIIRGKWGLTVGLVPFTTIGYEVTTITDDPDLDAQPVSQYSGDGGISQGYLGMGYKLYGRIDTAGNVTSLAFGANVNYNFGTLNATRMNFFPQDTEARGLSIDQSILVRDASFDLGVHYQRNLIKRTITDNKYLKLLLGASYSFQTDLSAKESEFAYTFTGTTGLSLSDTINYKELEPGSITLPQRYTVGLGLDFVSSKKTRLRFTADYTSEEWSSYKTSFQDESLSFEFQNSDRYSAGLELTPQLGSTSYLKTVEYRVGVKYEKSNLNLRNTDIEDIGMSFGLTLPIHHRRSITQSTFSISGVVGNHGTTENGLIQEDYFRIYMGFSFTPHFRNKWFIQPKYD